MAIPDIRRLDPSALADLLNFENAERPWQPAELAAVLRHQLAAPVEFDLAGMGEPVASRLKVLTQSQGLLLTSIGDLLRHPHPPIELLTMLKNFAKAHVLHPASPLPREIATVLYYAAILVAQDRCDQRITTLDNDTIEKGLTDLLGREWLNEPLRVLFADGLRRLSTREATQ